MSIYKEIVDFIEEKVKNGTYPKGFMLPPESELCEMFKTSRMTVRKALDDLSRRGVVYKVKGKGTFVSNFEMYKDHVLKGFSQIMEERGFEYNSTVQDFGVVAADNDVARGLSIPTGSRVYNLKRVRCIYGEPVGIEEIFLSCERFPNFLQYDFNVHSFYKILRKEYNTVLSRVEKKISTIEVTGEDAKVLFKRPRATALFLECTGYDRNTLPIEYERNIFNGSRYFIDVVV
ncbi:MAG: GntR family transcriptional regulator [Clostridiales bacterium]|nr:GntR family transcriptional regulator [Clostridiales bacterium]